MKIMKRNLTMMLFVLTLMISLISCNKEELFNEPVVVVIEDDPTNTDDTDDNTNDPTLPCDFTLENIQPNATIIINCILDLGGQTVNLPANVTLEYEGGDIINGTLNFGDGGIIDASLLNSTLALTGSSPQVKDPTFTFEPDRWGIVEGVVSDEVATTNTSIINETISSLRGLGIDTFVIDKMDAYFGINTETRKPHAIFVPSNFNLIMSDNTNLRVQPNGLTHYALLFSWEVDNVLISGGKLWGDRNTHDYNSISSSHEWGHVIFFKAVHNGVVDNVEMHEGTGDGFYLSSSSDRNADGSLKPDRRESFNITVKNCLLDGNRRDNISLVDGRDIFIEYNTIRNTGNGNSVSPAVGLIVESREQKTPDGNSLNKWEIVENVHIRHNIFEDNFSDIVLLSGEKAYIYENTFKSTRAVTVSAAADGEIYNNKFERPEGLMSNSFAVTLESRYFANGEDRVKNYEVINNTFTGYQYAILAGGQGHKIKDNTITECKRGIILGNLRDIEFDNNTISSNVSDSFGYYTFSGETFIRNCLIKNGETDVIGTPLFFSNKNNDEAGDITIDNVDFNGRVRLEAVQNITIKNSIYSDIKLVDCNPTLINNNN